MHVRYFFGYVYHICLQDTIQLSLSSCLLCQAMLPPMPLRPLLLTTRSGIIGEEGEQARTASSGAEQEGGADSEDHPITSGSKKKSPRNGGSRVEKEEPTGTRALWSIRGQDHWQEHQDQNNSIKRGGDEAQDKSVR